MSMDESLLFRNRLENVIKSYGSISECVFKIFPQICRTCLCDGATHNLESKCTFLNDPDLSIRNILETTTGFQISKKENLPDNICDKCLSCLKTSFLFRTQTQRVEGVLKTYSKQIELEISGKGFENKMGPLESSNASGQVTRQEQVDNFQISVFDETSTSNKFKCTPCNVKFDSQVDFDKHNASHNEKNYKCRLCYRQFLFQSGLNFHLQTYHETEKSGFLCGTCNKRFKGRVQFNTHKQTPCIKPGMTHKFKDKPTEIIAHVIGDSDDANDLVLEIKNVSCCLCDRLFKTESDFKIHLSYHIEKQCPVCNKSVSSPLCLESHVRKHKREAPFVCPLCFQGFTGGFRLRHHIKYHLKTQNTSVCNICEVDCSNMRQLLEHIKIHKRKEDDGEKTAYAANNSKMESKILISNPLSIKDESFSCNDDNHVKSNLDIHKVVPNIEMQIEHKSNILTTDSEHDNIPESTVLNIKTEADEAAQEELEEPMQEHIFTISVKEERLDEEYEEQQFDNNLSLTNQDITLDHSLNSLSPVIANSIKTEKINDDESDTIKTFILPDSSGKYTCTIEECMITFQNHANILNHVYRIHCPLWEPFKCPLCENVLNSSQDLRYHLKMHIKNDYACEYCPKVYNQFSVLKKHVRTHTGERPYQCPSCGQKFKQRSAMRNHIRSHSAKKDFMCKLCPKAFFSYNGLLLHSRSHREIKELQCKVCKRQFAAKCRLVRHYKNTLCLKSSNITYVDGIGLT